METTKDVQRLEKPRFKDLAEEGSFREWVARVTGEMDYQGPGEIQSHEENVRILIGSEEDPGLLFPDKDGYPNFYGFPFVEQETADDAVYHLYRSAFEPEETTEQGRGRTAAYVRVYATVDVADKGRISCAGVMTSRYALATKPSGAVPVRLPDALVFHEPLIYMKDLACSTEDDLLDLYRAIRSSKVGAGD